MTDRRFALAEHLLETRPWQLFAMVEMGTDRIHHGFWKYMDPEHRKHEPGNPYEHAILDYYVHLDGLIGGCSRTPTTRRSCSSSPITAPSGSTAASASTSGCAARACSRRCAEPDGVCSPRDVGIDWSRTIAWGEGGYYARVFLNVEGREPRGVVAPADYERVRDDLAARLAAIPDEHGDPLADARLQARGALPRGRTASRPT